MIKVKITIEWCKCLAQSQLPNMKTIWENCEFFINQEIKECDFWIVWGSNHKKESVICPPENVFFIAPEPPAIHRYETKYLNQFNTIITSDRSTGHKNPLYQQQSLPWWLGYDSKLGGDRVLKNTTYDELVRNNHIHKSKNISVISSNKKSTEGHKKRFDFVKKLNQHFGDKIDSFGVGSNQCRYKWDAIAQYKYHIVIENCSIDDYWTEKLSDSILSEAYTFYYGCKNIGKYFNTDIYTEIDIEDTEKSIKIIEQKINEGAYEKNIDKIIEAKHLILNEYQLFPSISSLCSLLPIGKKTKTIIKPESKIYNFIYKIKNKIKKITHKLLFIKVSNCL
jgi:hypothetical protein